jgi:excisionase family DNA binding protein
VPRITHFSVGVSRVSRRWSRAGRRPCEGVLGRIFQRPRPQGPERSHTANRRCPSPDSPGSPDPSRPSRSRPGYPTPLALALVRRTPRRPAWSTPDFSRDPSKQTPAPFVDAFAAQCRLPGHVPANRGSGIGYDLAVPNLRIRQAAELLGVSDDTVRRWVNHGMLAVCVDSAGRKLIAGADLAEFARTNAPHHRRIRSASAAPRATGSSAWSPRSPATR